MRRALVALLVFAPLAAAHGQSIEVAQDVGRYHVIFYTYDTLSAFESVRLAWNVTDAVSQQRVEVPNATLTKRDYDNAGKLVNATTLPLQQRATGFLFADVRMGPEGRATYDVSLPPDAPRASAQFANCVYPATTPAGGMALRDAANGCAPVAARTPWPAGLALLGLGAAARATRRR